MKSTKLNQLEKLLDGPLTDAMLLLVMKKNTSEFERREFGNPYNYNRGFEWMQAQLHGFELTTVGGGSDGRSINDPNITAEFKATKFKGHDRSHSFSYNGTSRQPTLSEQEQYSKSKIMRDKFHYWDIVDYTTGTFVKTIKISNVEVWKALWPKWKASYLKRGAKDPRIGASVSTKYLDDNKIDYEIIIH